MVVSLNLRNAHSVYIYIKFHSTLTSFIHSRLLVSCHTVGMQWEKEEGEGGKKKKRGKVKAVGTQTQRFPGSQRCMLLLTGRFFQSEIMFRKCERSPIFSFGYLPVGSFDENCWWE